MAGAIRYTTRRRRCQAPALRRARHPERGGGNEAPQAFRRGEHMGPVGFDPRSFFSWDGRSPVSHPVSSYVRRPFPSKENRRISERDDLRPPVVPGGQEIPGDRFGIPKPRESGSVIGADLRDLRGNGPSCVLRKGVPQGQTESGGIVLDVICWSSSAQRRCDPTGLCAYRPSVSS